MASALDRLQQVLKGLPGLGGRSAERIALHLVAEKTEAADELVAAITEARQSLKRCPVTGNLTASERDEIYEDPRRDRALVCVVETIPDLYAIERSEEFRGTYHVLHGKLSPLKNIGPDALNLPSLRERVASGEAREVILALSNDIEGQATCHYIQDELLAAFAELVITRIGFGLPSGGGLGYADPTTVRNALEGRRRFHP